MPDEAVGYALHRCTSPILTRGLDLRTPVRNLRHMFIQCPEFGTMVYRKVHI